MHVEIDSFKSLKHLWQVCFESVAARDLSQLSHSTVKTTETETVKVWLNKWDVIALEQTSHIERRLTTETQVAYDNSTWHAINTR